MATLACEPFQLQGQRSFWTTQVDACGTSDGCNGAVCGTAGLLLQETEQGVTLATSGWVASLALNMLMTDARRRDSACGYAPGTLNGHWSESFMARGKPVGSHVRYVSPAASIRDTMLLIKAEVQETLQKLVDYDIAVDISVDVVYLGNNQMQANIEIFGTAIDPTRIAVTAQRSENSWAWIN